uniref:Uncharacterized protein n=1 Tax=Quercus lobata TaxID=97700 RepID=A0A7N2N1V0_QUELO
MDETDRTTGEFTDEEEDARRSSVFAELKPYCLELLELLQNPTKHSSAIPALLQLFRSSHPSALQPFFDSGGWSHVIVVYSPDAGPKGPALVSQSLQMEAAVVPVKKILVC